MLKSRVIKDRGDLNVWRHREEFCIDEQLFIGVYLAFCLSCYTLRNIKK